METTTLKDHVRDFWDRASCGEVYATGDSERAAYEQHRKVRYELEPYLFDFARFADGAGKDVLEIGVGMGADHLEWAKSGPLSLTGVDLTPRAIEHTQRRLGVCRELASEHHAFDRATVEALFQQFHTLRAEARCFELASIEARVTQLEALLQDLRTDLREQEGRLDEADAGGREEVRRGVDDLAELLTEAQRTFVAQHPLGAAALDQITVRRSRLVEVLASTTGLPPALRGPIEELARRPLVESTALLPEAVARWAQRAGKNVRLEVDHRGIEIPYGLSGVLGGVLSHLLRNAIAHGIETEAERRAEGKPVAGTVRISGWESEEGVAISVSDDGGGFDIEAIRARAGGLSSEAILGLSEAFESGISTIVTRGELAGAGVGLAAARAELASAGYCIRIAATSRQGTELRLTPISGTDTAPKSAGVAARNA